MPEQLGARLREARMKQGLSLRSLAQSIGVSASLVSQVEVGKTQPSVATLFALASRLSVSFDELLGMSRPGDPVSSGAPSRADAEPPARQKPGVIQRAIDNPVIEMEDGVRWEHLAAGPNDPADAMLVTYQPGATSSVEGKFMKHRGIEYAYLLEGELTLHLGDETYVLHGGDSIQFDSALAHLYSNRGDAVVRGVWFLAGRRPQADGGSLA
ncbi:cupin domain-containing protein [Mycetocola sp. 2940]|uniref:cupin domain-containing protein n=1 Tax=Mycetocola sp. 2940 TaxID=3156452 RepID=UPI0033937CC0